MIDTHAHLNHSQFDTDRDQVIQKAFDAGVDKIVEIADSQGEWLAACHLARRYPGKIWAALGFHPHYAADFKAEHGHILRSFLKQSPQALAIGEIGLDYAKSEAAADIQKETLKAMLELAGETGKPIVLHCRNKNGEGRGEDAFDDLFGMLEQHWKPGARARFSGVLHCFSGGVREAARTADFQLALGVDGPITYPKNQNLRDAIKAAGLSRVVLETDSPFLPPQSIRGSRNDPSRLDEIARALADLFEVPCQEVVFETSKNAQELFGLI
ncbi:MAG: TatD family hydrolase [Elusimicrobia bacterium]|nr:TatD family hydrolase [Elusimicrobiota bacterium]